ncbi:beta-ketoacyl synthase chain length factor, partial [Leptospira sp. SA-E8]|uniref:beta-ketoacyl synthase chain length factor n=1 Tax=Leptospira sp. SA-E8 TaxID=3422259 RepID=UPI003EB9104E
MQFSLTAWAACAPGLHQPQDWLAWARQPLVPLRLGRDGDVPALPEMPAMARRRLSPLGRMAVQAAWWCQ